MWTGGALYSIIKTTLLSGYSLSKISLVYLLIKLSYLRDTVQTEVDYAYLLLMRVLF